MLQIRDSDKQVIAATHGRGLFSSLGFSTNLPPVAAFYFTNITPCGNESVGLVDSSLNKATSVTWTITPNTFVYVGGTNANSKSPMVQFTSSDLYTVTQNVSNAYGSDTRTKTIEISVGGLNLPFIENWEDINNIARWTVDNPDDNITWEIANVFGNMPGNTAITLNNWDYTIAYNKVVRDGLISPPINLLDYSSVVLNFQYAYRRSSSVDVDSLAIYISTNCGASWKRLASYRDTTIVGPFSYLTNSDLNTVKFVPRSATDWCGNPGYGSCKTLNLSSYIGNTIKLKFENISGFGNNVYIDNIVVSGVSTKPKPVAKFTASSTTGCANVPITFTDNSLNAPNVWAWQFIPNNVTFNNGTSASSKSPTVTFKSGGVYTVKLAASNSGGSDTITKAAHINLTSMSLPTISITASDSVMCISKPISYALKANNEGTSPQYVWKLNGLATGDIGTTYTNNNVKNLDVVTCELTSNVVCPINVKAVSNPIKTVINEIPIVSLTLTKNKTCIGDIFFPLAGGLPKGGVYSGLAVASGNFYNTLSSVGANDVKYTYTNKFGCTDSAVDVMTVVGIPPVPTITQTGDILTCSEAGYTYRWFQDNALLNGPKGQTLQINTTANYSVEITSIGSCKTTSLNFKGIKTGLLELSGMSDFKIFPNPSKDNFIIEFALSKNKPLNIEVLDITGKQIYLENYSGEKGNNQHNIILKDFQSGSYILKISDNDNYITRVLILQK